MSTRAVYEFFSKKERIISVYIHSDGYPDGAAMYFNRALEDSDWDFNDRYEIYDFITKFVKLNDGEITAGAEAHGDLEYIYEIDLPQKQITTLELNWGRVEKAVKPRDDLKNEEIFDEVEVCSIKEFLKKHNKLLHYKNTL